MAGRLDGETLLVTGGARGIGAAIAAVAAREGAAVAIFDMNPAGEQVSAELRRSGVRSTFCCVDVTHEDAIAAGVAKVGREIGEISALVNNAGRNTYFDPVTMTVAEWNDAMDVDLRSAWLMARAVLPAMTSAGRGSIVNIASIHASQTSAGMFPYAAAKSGLVGLTRSLALEVAPHGIRVNAVSPGWVRTALVEEWFTRSPVPSEEEAAVLRVHPLGRIGDPAEIAEVVCFLASSAASYVTGAEWRVDGGLGARFA